MLLSTPEWPYAVRVLLYFQVEHSDPAATPRLSHLNFKKIQVGGNGHVIPSWQGLYKQDIKLTKNK